MHFRITIIILSLMTNIVTHTYLKPIRMRFVSGQGILELKETQGKKNKWEMVCIVRKNISIQTKSSILTTIT